MIKENQLHFTEVLKHISQEYMTDFIMKGNVEQFDSFCSVTKRFFNFLFIGRTNNKTMLLIARNCP